MVADMKLRRTRQTHLRNHLSIRAAYLRIIAIDHMENHRVIRLVAVVTMAMPITRTDVDFDIADPHLPVDFHLRIEKVRPRIGIKPTGVYDRHFATVDRRQISRHKQPVLPHILHQSLHDN